MAANALPQAPAQHSDPLGTFHDLISDTLRTVKAEADRKERIAKEAGAHPALDAASAEASSAADRVANEFDGIRKQLSSGEISPSAALHRAVGVCVREQFFHLLIAHGVPHPTYNYLAPYKSSALPWDRARRRLASSAPSWKVLGFDVGFPIGIPSSVLTANADWVAYYAACGFNVLTFKTVRTEERPPHQFPNWLFVEGCTQPIPPEARDQHKTVRAHADLWPDQPERFSMVNSFGVPSVHPREWQEELRKAHQRIGSDQLLIVSVTGNERLPTIEKIAADYSKAALMAMEAGAVAVELNLSCPNNTAVDGHVKEDMLCHDPESAAAVAAAVRKAVGSSVKLIAKMSYMPRERLEEVVRRCVAQAEIDGVSGINTWQVEVKAVGSDQLAFPGRQKAGLSGVGIRQLGFDFARSLVDIRDKLGKRDLEILAMGGVMTADDVEQFLSLGVGAVQTATAAFFNAALAEEVADRYRTQYQGRRQESANSRALEVLSEGPKTFSDVLSELSDVLAPTEIEIAGRARSVLRELEKKGLARSFHRDGRLVFESVSSEPPTHVSAARTK